MRDGATKRPCFGFFSVNMNPLVITCGISKSIDLLLCDGDPIAHSDFLSDTSGQFSQSLKCFHWFSKDALQNPVRIELIEMLSLQIKHLERASTGSARTEAIIQSFPNFPF